MVHMHLRGHYHVPGMSSLDARYRNAEPRVEDTEGGEVRFTTECLP